MNINLPSESTVKAVSYAAIALAGVYYIMRFSDFHAAGRETLKPITDKLFSLYQDLKGYDGVEATSAYVVLRPRDFSRGSMAEQAKLAALGMHPRNGEILTAVLDASDRPKFEYAAYLNAGKTIVIDINLTVNVL
ncbi:hypothetical protein ORI99_01835 [Alishewanella sp. SMS9]|nr:hypothetical protein [Alishewanella sp. SMS9]